MMRKLWLLAGLAGAIAVTCAACIFISQTPRAVTDRTGMTAIYAPCKAHLYDGELVLFPDGFSMSGGFLAGTGTRWNLDRTASFPVDGVLADSVAFLEYCTRDAQPGPLAAGLLGPICFAAALGDPEIYKAFFGSCPTIYTQSARGWSCEAECFTYSLAPWNERSDLDRLDRGETMDGVYRIKLRNEALETHYVNSLSLVAVDHAPGCEAFPDPQRKTVLFGSPVPLLSATDRTGRDVLEQVSARDERWWESDTAQTRELENCLTRDWIDVRFTVPRGAEKMVVAFRLRNTLMTTVYLYDVALGMQGLHALEWMDWGLTDLVSARPSKERYLDVFGLKIESPSRESLYVTYSGPICWKVAAVELRAPEPGPAELRFSSLPGNWAIDWIGISIDARQDFTAAEYLPVRVNGYPDSASDSLAALLSKSDRRYLVTYPRDAYEIEFHPSPPPPERARSYFIASGGYYIEWIRHEWFAGSRAADVAVHDEDIARTAALWLEKKESFEQQFFGSRLAEAGRIQP